jgi:hypothetical protein
MSGLIPKCLSETILQTRLNFLQELINIPRYTEVASATSVFHDTIIGMGIFVFVCVRVAKKVYILTKSHADIK